MPHLPPSPRLGPVMAGSQQTVPGKDPGFKGYSATHSAPQCPGPVLDAGQLSEVDVALALQGLQAW